MRSRSELREDQVYLADLISTEPFKLVVAPMGRGKSAAALTALRRLHDEFVIRHTLVVAPLRVAQDVWPEEIGLWQHTTVFRRAACVGTPEARRAALRERAEITIVNRENLPWLWHELRDGADWFFDMVVVDESSMFKAGKRRTKTQKLTRFGVLARARQKIDRVVLLTGTPSPNGLIDLWGQIYLLDQGERLGKTKNAFLSRWFDQDRYGYKITPKAHAEKEIMAAIADLMVSLPPLDLVPPPVFVPVRVRLPATILKEYRRFERTLVSEAYDVEAVSRGVLTNKLLQYANGSCYKSDREVVPIHDLKMDALDDLIERAAGEPVLVFYSFRFDLDAIRKRHPHAVVLGESSTAVKDWNEGRIPLMLAHPASGGHGLNLQYGGHIAVWFGLTWSLESFLQANARLPRPGQKNLVVIYQIIAEGTADEDVLSTLERKGATQDAVNAAVRVRVAQT